MPRDSAGNYTLPAGNPVASGEIISANWANTTMEDLGDALSASLDRYGRGGMLAPFAFADGTSSAPGATWSNEPTTGLYRNAYADLRMTVTGQDNQRWTATSSFLWRNSQWQEIVTIGTNTGTLTVDDLVVNNSLTVDTDTLVVDPTNNRVGIGTSGPTTPLHVELSSSSFRVAPLTDTTQVDTFYGSVYKRLQFRSSEYGYKLADGSEAMTITSSGNVGIGTTSPSSDSLSVDKGSIRIRNATGFLSFSDAGSDATEMYIQRTSSGQQMALVSAGPASNGFITFKTGGTAERMRIDSSGRIQVGNNLPVWSGQYGGALLLKGDNITSNRYAQLAIVDSAGSVVNDGLTLDNNGNLLVGKSAAAGVSAVGFEATPLGITYTSYSGTQPCAHFNRGGNGLGLKFYVGTVDAGGITFTQSGTPSFAAASDERLKDNITDHESELANVMALRPVRWDWKANDNSGEGFIAQELQKTAWADLVSEGEEGMLQVSGLGVVETRLIKAIQEQQAMIEDLKAEVEALKG